MSTRNADVGRGLLYIFSDAADTYMPLVLDLSPEVLSLSFSLSLSFLSLSSSLVKNSFLARVPTSISLRTDSC